MQLTRRGFLGALAGAAATAVAAKVLPFAEAKPVLKGEVGVIRDFVIVTDKPYLADPTGMRDSTQAFQDAIDSGAREIRIPAGTYQVSGVVINRNVTIKGAGSDKSTLVCFGGKPCMTIDGVAAGGVVGVSGLNLVGAGTGDGMLVRSKAHIDGCRVQGFRDGVRFEAPGDDQTFFSTISNTEARDNSRDGFAFGEGACASTAFNCSAYGNGRYGFYAPTTKRTYGNSIYGAYAA